MFGEKGKKKTTKFRFNEGGLGRKNLDQAIVKDLLRSSIT